MIGRFRQDESERSGAERRNDGELMDEGEERWVCSVERDSNGHGVHEIG